MAVEIVGVLRYHECVRVDALVDDVPRQLGPPRAPPNADTLALADGIEVQAVVFTVRPAIRPNDWARSRSNETREEFIEASLPDEADPGAVLACMVV